MQHLQGQHHQQKSRHVMFENKMTLISATADERTYFRPQMCQFFICLSSKILHTVSIQRAVFCNIKIGHSRLKSQ